ncbi:hypothetical protein GCM10010372_65730 [Streptomyces tauricus]|uniref:hypothetical protein n=1 Tax=Streptomyces tauricus TaxID=68274 RepID=UPI0016783DAA|nr:hypothetical protein [Streptomyces tauricus]GHA56587.1 hypothetical protein GCM10010372_65730 [Streptomyces tauricus]
MRSCSTWRSQEEEHRFLEPDEADWLKKELDTNNVDTFMVCLAWVGGGAKQCRNLRTYWQEKPFRKPLRLPEPE